jgi:hypothetical protein
MFAHARCTGNGTPPAVLPILEKALANEATFGATLENWLAQRAKR